MVRALDRRSKGQGFESRQEHKNNFDFFSSQKGCDDSLSVYPAHVYVLTHTNDHVRTLKILLSMSEFGGLRKDEDTQHALAGLGGSAALAAAVVSPSLFLVFDMFFWLLS